MDNISEVWKPIVGYEGLYEVSDHGRVKSLLFGKERIMKLCFIKLGGRDRYARVRLWKNKIVEPHLIHQLVLTAFTGPRPKGMEASHIDSDSRNNHLLNLIYETHLDNMKRKRGYSYNRGRNNSQSKHTEEDISIIRGRYAAGETIMEIAISRGAGHSTIASIVHRRTWRHV